MTTIPPTQRLLDQLTAANIPVHGVALVTLSPLVWRIDFKDEATPEQRNQGNALAATFDPTVEATGQAAILTTIKTTAQSAVGVTLNNLTAAQVRALLAVLLWKEGAIASDGTIRPLREWVKNGS